MVARPSTSIAWIAEVSLTMVMYLSMGLVAANPYPLSGVLISFSHPSSELEDAILGRWSLVKNLHDLLSKIFDSVWTCSISYIRHCAPLFYFYLVFDMHNLSRATILITINYFSPFKRRVKRFSSSINFWCSQYYFGFVFLFIRLSLQWPRKICISCLYQQFSKRFNANRKHASGGLGLGGVHQRQCHCMICLLVTKVKLEN